MIGVDLGFMVEVFVVVICWGVLDFVIIGNLLMDGVGGVILVMFVEYFGFV